MMRKNWSRFISVGSLVGLLLGVVAGVLARNEFLSLSNAIPYAQVFTKVWIVVLIFITIPLVAMFVLQSLLKLFQTKSTGKLVAYGLGIHIIMLVVVAIVSVALSSLVMKAGLLETVSLSEMLLLKQNSGGGWAEKLGLLQVGLARLIVPVIVTTILLTLMISFLPGRAKQKISTLASIISQQLFSFLQYAFLLLPFSVACLAFAITFHNGSLLAGVAGFYVLGVALILTVFIGLQYVAVHFFGHVPAKDFAQAMLPAQLGAASTCSSLATLPALLVSAKRMGIADEVTGTTVPVFVSLFRINLIAGNPFSFFLLSHIYGLPIEWPTLLIFLGLMMITTFGSPGLPQTGNVYSMPVFLAAGIPLEGVVLLKAFDAIPDIFKTVLNVTEVGAVTSIMVRWTKSTVPVISEPGESRLI